MSDLDVLRDLTDQVRAPRFDDLVTVARQRNRRAALGAGVAAVALLVAAAAAVSGWPGLPRASEPARSVTPSPSATAWTPERIRAEGRLTQMPEFRQGLSETGLDAKLYCVAQSCAFLDSEKNRRWALEVTQGGRSALFDLDGIPWGRDYDADSLLVMDGTGETGRFRLLQADGTAVPLRMLSDPVSAAPGHDVMLLKSLEVYRRGYMSPSESPQPHRVDEQAGTIRPLDVPQDVDWWGPNVEEALWGATGCSVYWQRDDGTFTHRQLDCKVDEGALTDPTWQGPEPFAGWFKPGRMALVEWNEDGSPAVLHASVDRGRTWQAVGIESRPWDDTTEQIANALTEALRHVS